MIKHTHAVRSARKRELRRKCPTCHGRKVFMHGEVFAVRTCHTCAGKGTVKL